MDVDLLGRLLTRVAEMGTDLQAFLARGLRPKGSFVSLAPFEEKDAVKAAGFVWEPKAKLWTMRMAYDDVAALPFKVREVTP